MFKSILTGYIDSALFHAEYDKLEDGTFSGRIPGFKGVITFRKTLRECENDQLAFCKASCASRGSCMRAK